eukprot:gene8306-5994_t
MASVAGMDKIAKTLDAKFMLAVGDNYYHSGVTDESDPRFGSTFEKVYSPDSLQFPWYAIAGNHDHIGNVSAQIAYTNNSPRWEFPNYYHAHHFVGDDGASIDIIMIDTVELSGLSRVNEDEPGYFDTLPLLARSMADSQWTWIEQQIQASTADYLLVVGHYPVYSVCEHGNNPTLIENLRPLLVQYGGQYLCGHDHCMEHLVEPGTSTNYFLSGMGAYCCYFPKNKDTVPADSLKWYMARDNAGKDSAGFTSFQLTKKEMLVTFYNQDGDVVYTAPAIAPRSSSQKQQPLVKKD